jgi:hypothetical protein
VRNFTRAIPFTTAAVLLVLGIATVARAGTAVPEINPTDGVSALALVGGAILVIRAYRKK